VVRYIEQQANGCYQSKDVKRRIMVKELAGTLARYAERMNWMPAGWSQEGTAKRFAECDKDFSVKSAKNPAQTGSEKRKPKSSTTMPRAVVFGECLPPVTNREEGRKGESGGHKEPSEKADGGGGSQPAQGDALPAGVVLEVETEPLVECESPVLEQEGPSLEPSTTEQGLPLEDVRDSEETSIASPGNSVPEKEVRVGRHGRMQLVETPEKMCGKKCCVWEAFEKGNWVTGSWLEGKHCPGIRDGRLCNREFVGERLAGKRLFSDTEWFPSARSVAYGCMRCRRVMCGPCRWHHDDTVNVSPAQKKRREEE
jgi:hypothetical protein